MVSRIVHATLISLPALALTCALSFTAHAQDDAAPPPKAKKARKAKAAKTAPAAAATTETPAAKSESPSLVKASGGEGETTPQGENLKFNTDSEPVNTDRHAPMVFKDAGDAPLGTPRPEYAESAPEDSGYKAYIGYPKHQLGVYAAPMSVSSKWTEGGAGYNFTTSATALGINYRLQATPMWSTEIDYQHFTLKLDPTTLKVGTTPLAFLDSKANFDNYYIRNKFCMIGKSTFYQQLCPGFDIGNDGYPIINYETNSSLAMARVQDLIIGLNLTYQAPIGQKLMFRGIVGYNYGTGIGNSGYLSSKGDSSYFGDASLEYAMTDHHMLVFGADYKARKAKVEGLKGPTVTSWQTESSTFGGKLGYTYTF